MGVEFDPGVRCYDCKTTRDKSSFTKSYLDNGQYRCRECVAKWRKKRRKEGARGFTKMLIWKLRDRAREKGLPFDLHLHTDELVERMSKGRCEMTGIELRFGGDRQFDTASVDRIVPELGYVYSNIRILCWAMNSALGTWGEDKLRLVMAHWAERDKERYDAGGV